MYLSDQASISRASLSSANSRQTSKSTVSYPHVVKPVPVWISEGVQRKSSMATLKTLSDEEKQSLLGSNHLKVQDTNSRWNTLLNHTTQVNALPLPNETRVDVQTLNSQTDLEGDFTGITLIEEARNPSLSSKKRGLKSIFRTRSTPELILPLPEPEFSDQLRKPSMDSHASSYYYARNTQRHNRMDDTYKSRLSIGNPYAPIVLRLITFMLAVVSLSLASNLLIKMHGHSHSPSTVMAICCQSVALIYLIYTGYDEYAGKPLGLRDAREKMRLIMVDLLFIVFESANISLAIYDSQQNCNALEDLGTVICPRQSALTSFLFFGLFSWLLTFTVSIFRVIEKVAI